MTSTPRVIRPILTLVLGVAVVAATLIIPSAAPALAEPVSVSCAEDAGRCDPPPLLNKQLLQDPSGIFFATSEEAAALSRLEDAAVTNTLSDLGLPDSDRAAVRSWGRYDALAQLWALLTKAIRTDPGARSNDQRLAVTWLTEMMNRRAEVISTNAGWEYLKWAGRVGATDPKPSTNQILSDLAGFDDDTILPVNYRTGSPATSDSGYCAYTPPSGLESEYKGRPGTDGSTAGSQCFAPYKCNDPLGCDNNQPTFDSFLRWGEADLVGDPSKDREFALTADGVARGVTMASVMLGAGLVGTAIGSAIGLTAGSAIAAALFPYLSGALVADFAIAGGSGVVLGNAVMAGMMAGAVATAVTVAIVAIAIAVLKGIQVTQAAAVPGQLRDAITNALQGTPDLQITLTDQDSLAGLFSLFVRASGPNPKPERCDNSQLVFGGTVAAPCANRPVVPAPRADDAQFTIQRLDGTTGLPTGPVARVNQVSVVDTALDPSPTRRTIDGTFTHLVRPSGSWFVTQTSDVDGTTYPAYASLRLNYLVPYPTPMTATAWLRRQGDGSYRFLQAIKGMDVNPATCVGDGTCSVTSSIKVFLPGQPTMVPTLLSIVPRAVPTFTIAHSANPVVGQPVTLSASTASPGSFTYQWYVKQAGGLTVVCPESQPYCAYEGPFTGAQTSFTWQGSGTFKVVLLATDQSGRTYPTETTVDVGSVGPALSINEPGPADVNATAEISGSIVRAGSAEKQHLTVDWGDGTQLSGTYSSTTPPGCSSCNPMWWPTSQTQLDWWARHTWTKAGSFQVTVTVTNDSGQLDRKYTTVTVAKGSQSIAFGPLADHALDEHQVVVEATGGRSSLDARILSRTPEVCTIAAEKPTRVDGVAHASSLVDLLHTGTCTLRATHFGDDNYEDAGPVLRSFTISKGQQEIRFPGFADSMTVAHAPFMVAAGGGESLQPVLITSSTPQVCTTSETEQSRSGGNPVVQSGSTTLTLVGPGTCTLTAAQAGDDDWFAAESVQQSLDVLPYESQTLEFPAPAAHTYGDEPFEVTITGGGSSQPIRLVNGSADPVTGHPRVCALSDTVTGRADGHATLTALVSIIGAGECVLTAVQDGDDTHADAEPVSRTLTVAKATQTIDLDPIADRTYGDDPVALSATGGESMSFVELTSQTPDVCHVDNTTYAFPDGRSRTSALLTLVGAGTCTVTAAQDGTDDYAAAEPVSRSFRVARAAQTIELAPIANRTYGAAPFEITANGGGSTQPVTLTSTSPGVCTVGSVSNTRLAGLALAKATVTVVGAGTCQVVAQQAGDGNYLAASPAATRSFAVARAPLTVTADDKTMTLGGPVPAFTYRFSGFVRQDGPATVTGIVCKATTAAGQLVGSTTPVGSYPITCSGGASAGYQISYRPGSLAVRYAYADLTAYSATAENKVKAGATVSLMWTIQNAAGQPVTSPSSLVSITTTPMTCGGAVPTTGATPVPGALTEAKYDPVKAYWVYNWRTASTLSGSCVAFTVTLADGVAHTTRFNFSLSTKR